jgi:UDP-4-amino-4-deoxy-L-arabinose-oxoglutarate aminotransferase
MIPHSRPWILEQDARAVRKALDEKAVCCWKYADPLKRKLIQISGLPCADLYASGTLALRAGIKRVGLPAGSRIGIPSYTCQDVMFGVMDAGCQPVVLDCDRFGLMSDDAAAKAFKQKRIQALISVHQFGLINRSIEKLCVHLPVLEDCSHVPPRAFLRGSAGIFGSFEGTKFLGAGEGGYLLLRQKTKPEETAPEPRACLSDLMSVIAFNQLKRMEENIKRRQKIADQYRALRLPYEVIDGERAVWFRFLLRIESKKELSDILRKAQHKGIALRRPVMPYPLHRYQKSVCFQAEKNWEQFVSIPIYPDLRRSEVHNVCSFLKNRIHQ